jgi:hypothetical protein
MKLKSGLNSDTNNFFSMVIFFEPSLNLFKKNTYINYYAFEDLLF